MVILQDSNLAWWNLTLLPGFLLCYDAISSLNQLIFVYMTAALLERPTLHRQVK